MTEWLCGTHTLYLYDTHHIMSVYKYCYKHTQKVAYGAKLMKRFKRKIYKSVVSMPAFKMLY